MASISKEKVRRRTRSELSSTSSSENKSPQNRKPKNDNEEDKEMAEDSFEDKLNLILEKVSKIDIISEAVQRIETSLFKLETRVVAAEETLKTASNDIEDLKKSQNFMEVQVEQMKQDFVASVTIQEYNQRLDELESKDLYLEAYSRRENIKFLNIEEEQDENTEDKLRSFLSDDLEIYNVEDIEFQRVHRNGRSLHGKPRPILARFVRYKDVEKILSRGKMLKNTDYKMFVDLPRELVERRKKLIPILKMAKQHKIPAAFSKSKPDKLYVRGKEWIAGDELIV